MRKIKYIVSPTLLNRITAYIFFALTLPAIIGSILLLRDNAASIGTLAFVTGMILVNLLFFVLDFSKLVVYEDGKARYYYPIFYKEFSIKDIAYFKKIKDSGDDAGSHVVDTYTMRFYNKNNKLLFIFPESAKNIELLIKDVNKK
ncbi:MAG: hypothetical protein Q4B26_15830 [Eubacteriales bacterium]|nr:hypothetical protein [Eubacteriales bacterium]